MAVGLWTDQRNTYVFQKLALSQDEDQGAENVYRMLLHASQIWSYDLNPAEDARVVAAGVAPGHALELTAGGSDTLRVLFPVRIEDNCPWNRIRLSTFFHNTTGATITFTVKLYYSLLLSGWTTAVSKTEVDFTFLTWNPWAVIDISGFTVGQYHFQMEVIVTAGVIRLGASRAEFMSTVTGLVA